MEKTPEQVVVHKNTIEQEKKLLDQKIQETIKYLESTKEGTGTITLGFYRFFEGAIKMALSGEPERAKKMLEDKMRTSNESDEKKAYTVTISDILTAAEMYKEKLDEEKIKVREEGQELVNKIKEQNDLKNEQEELDRENKKAEKKKRQIESQERLKRQQEEDKKEHHPTIDSITIPPNIKMEYKEEKTEETPAETKEAEKPAETKEAEKPNNSIEIKKGAVMESEGLVRKINNYLKIIPPEKTFVVTAVKPWTNKNGETRHRVFLKGEGKEVPINRETLIKMIEDYRKTEKYIFLSKGDTVLVNGKKYEILNATKKTIKFKEEGADIPVNIDREKMEELLFKNKYEIIKKERKAKETKKTPEEDKKEDVVTEEKIIKEDLDTKEEAKVEPEDVKKDLNTMEIPKKINNKTHELGGKDTIESLRAKSAAAQASGDYEAAELFEKNIRALVALDKKKTGADKDSIARLDAESKKAQESGDYERAQELEDMKKKHKKGAEHISKIEDLNESEIGSGAKVIEATGGFHAEEEKESAIVNYGGFDDKEATKAAKVEAVKVDIIEKLKLDTANKSPLWAKNLGSSGLKVSDLENVPGFVKLSTGEQLLVLEEINQRNARKMEELTKDRVAASYANKNIFMKVLHGLSKNFQKASAEKTIAGQIRNGEHSVDIETIGQISARIKELNLTVNEQTGEVVFLKAPEGMSTRAEAEQIRAYNEIANRYMKMPTDWQHEKTANKNGLNPFKSNEYKEFQKIDSAYNAIRNNLISSMENHYLSQGNGAKEARLMALDAIRKSELGFDYLNYTRKYPEAAALLENSATQKAYKKLLTGDLTTFAGGGVIGMAIKSTVGAYGGGAIWGGIRGFFTGKKSIKDDYKGDQVSMTRLEAKNAGLKNSESKVDRFINADDQIKKISFLVEELNKEGKTPEQKEVLAQRIKSRLDYINNKEYKGFINYGKKDDIAKNFELNKAIATGTAALLVYKNGEPMMKGIEDLYSYKTGKKDKDGNDITENGLNRIKRFDNYQESIYEDKRTARVMGAVVRGAAIGLAGAVAGQYYQRWLHGGVTPTPSPTPETLPIPDAGHGLDVTIDRGQGMIHFAGQLKHAVAEKWGSDMSNAPESVKHIMNTSNADLAKEFGGFKPGQIDESAMLHKGANFHMDDQGNLTFKDPVTGESDVFEWGKDISKGADYHGKMFDYKGSNINGAPHGISNNINSQKNIFDNGQVPTQLGGGGSIELNSISDIQKYGITPGQFSLFQKIALENHIIDKPLVMPDGHLDQVQLLKVQDYAIKNHFIETPILHTSGNTVIESATAGADSFRGFNSIEKIHEIQNIQLADLKNQLGEKNYTELIKDLKEKGILYESDGKTLRAISTGTSPDLEHIQYARDMANSNASKEIFQQTGLNKLSLENSADTYDKSFKLEDGTYSNIIVRETHNINGHEVGEITSQPHTGPDPVQLKSAGGGNKVAEVITENKAKVAAENIPTENKIHSGFNYASKAFPMDEKVAGISREQFDKVALSEIKSEMNLDPDTKLIETPEIGHRLWMYENFGKISQSSEGQNSWDMESPDVNLGRIKDLSNFMFKHPNDSITLAIKKLGSRVMEATGRKEYEMPKMDGISAEQYTKNLIEELYK
ncbi:MAG: hypothetical protein NTX85_00685 [Candidatus Nomurabacteria bacterium]|nr:hypothetical protein [Candidatus Nomurabacteria bacterium]